MNHACESCVSSPLEQLRATANRQLTANRIPVEFSPELASLTAADVSAQPCRFREDLRALPCLTIDCADTQDMDDAVGLIPVPGGWQLCVHIADVSAYVPQGSALEAAALERGTSIYLPHQTIPMLPAVLSNDLCSLNPQADRRALSVLTELDRSGAVRRCRIVKSLIRSRVKGVYPEVDDLLAGRCSEDIRKKYAAVSASLFEMHALAQLLRRRRAESGAELSDNTVSRPVVRDGRISFSVERQGPAESMIEEFMVLTNRLVAEYLRAHDLPAIFRVQSAKGQLARYTAAEGRHAALALDHYAHFTSPIRRLADLKIHQVLTAHLDGADSDSLWERFGADLQQAAERATRCENRSDQVCLSCRRFCAGQFLFPLQSQEFTADVVGRNFQNRPIFLLDEWQLRVVGRAGLQACQGLHVALRLSVTDTARAAAEVQSFRRLGPAA